MEIVRVDPDDEAALRDAWTVYAAAHQADLPWLPALTFTEYQRFSRDQPSRRRERWVARSDGRTLGQLQLVLPLLDNTDTATLELHVDPSVRRRGVGTALLQAAARRSREAGRTRLLAELAEPLQPSDAHVAAGPRFAEAAGAVRVLEEICRVLDLDSDPDQVGHDRFSALESAAWQHAEGYALVQWVGPVADDLIDDFARLRGGMTTDAPMEDLEWEPERWDAARIREVEAVNQEMGRRWMTTAAREVATGRLVAYSDLGVVVAQPEVAFQWDTIVEHAHRGHRLGVLVKLANLSLLRTESPGSRRIVTWNAQSNQHMVAINDALGFRPRGRWAEWQLSL